MMVQNARRKLRKGLQKVVQKTLQRNAYFAHPEAILLSMLADSNGVIRAQAVNTILTICMKTNQASQSSTNTLPPDDRGVDEIDDDNELSDDEEASFTQ